MRASEPPDDAAPRGDKDADDEHARDTQNEARMRSLARRVEELTTDIGSVLHANTSILLMGQQTIDVAMHALGPNPFSSEGAPSYEEADEVLGGPARAAAKAIERFMESLADRPEVLGQSNIEKMRGWVAMLADHVSAIPEPFQESRASTLRTIACQVEDILNGLPSGQVRKQLLREAKSAVHEIERISAIASLLRTRSAILQMDYTIRSFREFVTSDMRRAERAEKLVLASVIESAHNQLVEYAHTSAVEIKVRNQYPNAQIMGVERDLVRAFANLIHNAVKYSWHRDKSQMPWVGVTVERDGRMLRTTVENWGVPISRQELADGLIFELGYRGKWSTDRGRLGTGVGLTDSREVVERHRGSLEVESRPSRSWGPDDIEDETYYQQPFITKVVVRLPEAL